MYSYFVIVRRGGQSVEFPVDGTEYAWALYRKAVELCELTGGQCDLVDNFTGEAVESFGYEADLDLGMVSDDPAGDWEDEWPDDPDLEMGFDPYMGCYSYDC